LWAAVQEKREKIDDDDALEQRFFGAKTWFFLAI
jgi:hypothetical protein